MARTVDGCFEQDQRDLSVAIPDGVAPLSAGDWARVYFMVSHDFVIDHVTVTLVRWHAQ